MHLFDCVIMVMVMVMVMVMIMMSEAGFPFFFSSVQVMVHISQLSNFSFHGRCLLAHCYSLWFVHLPAYIKLHHNKAKVLHVAFEVNYTNILYKYRTTLYNHSVSHRNKAKVRRRVNYTNVNCFVN